ncbi:unnamed protein product [Rhizoctonia solani]|uniref:DDE Tnp4 domain-containing protein n=1 Tax=Rhizoctonia solani TaxID=456999 RepID=A0A8H3I1M6_9AGAM|nr:unnamed protein product [Rhizoctonia solani]
MNEASLQETFALVPSVLSRYLEFSLGILATVLRENIREARICWPTPAEMGAYAKTIRKRHRNIVGAFGFMDGLSLPVGTSSDPEIEQSTYNGWLHSHRITNVLVFAPDGCIISAQVNAPGSWHDSRTATNVYQQLRTKTPNGYFLIADTAFPRVGADLAGKIQTPLKERARLADDPNEAAQQIAYSNSITSARQPAEWGMRALQGAYGRLRMPLDINNPIGRRVLIETCLRLHNLRTRLIGINQIKRVYMPVWGSETPKLITNAGTSERDLHYILQHDRPPAGYYKTTTSRDLGLFGSPRVTSGRLIESGPLDVRVRTCEHIEDGTAGLWEGSERRVGSRTRAADLRLYLHGVQGFH